MLLLLQSARIFQPEVIKRRRPFDDTEVDDGEDLLLMFFMLMALTPTEK